VSISNKTAIVFDRGGLYTYLARTLGQGFGKVYYYIPDSSSYPESSRTQIGKGFEEIERIYDRQLYKLLKKIDLIVFPDCYDGYLQKYIAGEGIPIFGSGPSAELEIDKILFIDKLDELGMPLAATQIADSVDDLLKILMKIKGEVYIKGVHRGDFETRKHVSMKQTQNWLEQYLIPKLGSAAKTTKFIIQRKIKTVAETGYDGNRINGVCMEKHLCGIEAKDAGYMGKILNKIPVILRKTVAPLNDFYKGYNGAYSNEVIITEDGIAFPIDETDRVGSPPGELLTLIWKNYPEAVDEIAHGRIPVMKEVAPYGAELILTSHFNENHEICVEYPKEYEANIKLKNCVRKNGVTYIIPNDNAGFFGAVCATGTTMKQATERCFAIAKEVITEDLVVDFNAFKKVQEAINAAKRFGVNLE
jgi:hypothetical protein